MMLRKGNLQEQGSSEAAQTAQSSVAPAALDRIQYGVATYRVVLHYVQKTAAQGQAIDLHLMKGLMRSSDVLHLQFRSPVLAKQ
jgi:hypothetical protein